MFFVAMPFMSRSTAISLACIGRPWMVPVSRASSGTSRNNSSTEPAPITSSMAERSASLSGRYLIELPRSFEFLVDVPDYAHDFDRLKIGAVSADGNCFLARSLPATGIDFCFQYDLGGCRRICSKLEGIIASDA